MGPFKQCVIMKQVNSKQQLSMPASFLDLSDWVKTPVKHLAEMNRNCWWGFLNDPQATDIYWIATSTYARCWEEEQAASDCKPLPQVKSNWIQNLSVHKANVFHVPEQLSLQYQHLVSAPCPSLIYCLSYLPFYALATLNLSCLPPNSMDIPGLSLWCFLHFKCPLCLSYFPFSFQLFVPLSFLLL